jgi:hypothetical protein
MKRSAGEDVIGRMQADDMTIRMLHHVTANSGILENANTPGFLFGYPDDTTSGLATFATYLNCYQLRIYTLAIPSK